MRIRTETHIKNFKGLFPTQTSHPPLTYITTQAWKKLTNLVNKQHTICDVSKCLQRNLHTL